MRRLPAVCVALLVLVAAGCGGSSAATTTTAAGGGPQPCAGSQLTGRFAVVPGSAGAGNIVYRLTLRNRSHAACTLEGLPAVTLLAGDGTALPTHVTAANRGPHGAIRLAHGASARATARFSPDVPGVGEGGRSRCERTAAKLRVLAPGGGRTTVPIAPPTPVCEHGRLSFARYGR